MKTFKCIFAILILTPILKLVLIVSVFLQSYITKIDDLIETFKILKPINRRLEL